MPNTRSCMSFINLFATCFTENCNINSKTAPVFITLLLCNHCERSGNSLVPNCCCPHLYSVLCDTAFLQVLCKVSDTVQELGYLGCDNACGLFSGVFYGALTILTEDFVAFLYIVTRRCILLCFILRQKQANESTFYLHKCESHLQNFENTGQFSFNFV